MPHHDIAVLLDRSHTFEYALRVCLIGDTERAIAPGSRTSAVFGFGKIALEHGSGFQQLLAADNPVSALALVRLQFEAVVRGAWILFSAPDSWVAQFSSPPASNDAEEPAEFPKMYQLLDQLGSSSAEPDLVTSLASLKTKAWDSLNSYTHGGLRSMVRTLNGHEEELLVWMLRTQNSLSYTASQLIARVADDATCSNKLFQIRNEMADCLHSS